MLLFIVQAGQKFLNDMKLIKQWSRKIVKGLENVTETIMCL